MGAVDRQKWSCLVIFTVKRKRVRKGTFIDGRSSLLNKAHSIASSAMSEKTSLGYVSPSFGSTIASIPPDLYLGLACKRRQIISYSIYLKVNTSRWTSIELNCMSDSLPHRYSMFRRRQTKLTSVFFWTIDKNNYIEVESAKYKDTSKQFLKCSLPILPG